MSLELQILNLVVVYVHVPGQLDWSQWDWWIDALLTTGRLQPTGQRVPLVTSRGSYFLTNRWSVTWKRPGGGGMSQ